MKKAYRLLSILLVLAFLAGCLDVGATDGKDRPPGILAYKPAESTLKATVSKEDPSDDEQEAFLARKAEIEARYQQLQIEMSQPSRIFAEDPVLNAPYQAGTPTDEFFRDGLLMTNFIRFLAYLNDDVKLNNSWNEMAQHAAVIMLVNDDLDHEPERPADMDQDFYELGAKGAETSNIHAGWGYRSIDLPFTVRNYMSDSDPSNVARVGHRRWILNPAMTDVGFGYAQEGDMWYSAMKVFDDNTNTIWRYSGDYAYIAWPSQAAFPLEFFADNDPWFVSLNHKEFDSTKTDQIRVTLRNIKDGREWVFTQADLGGSTASSRYHNVDTQGFGAPFCIIFRPDGVEYRDGDTYSVTVENIYRLMGQKAGISYVTQFFELERE